MKRYDQERKQRKTIEVQREKQVKALNHKNNQKPVEDISSEKEIINEIKLVPDVEEKLIRKNFYLCI